MNITSIVNQAIPSITLVPDEVKKRISARVLGAINGNHGSKSTAEAATKTTAVALPVVVAQTQKERIATQALALYRKNPEITNLRPSTGYMGYIFHLMKGTSSPEQIAKKMGQEVVAKYGKTIPQLPTEKVSEKVVKAFQQTQCSPSEYIKNGCHPEVTNTTLGNSTQLVTNTTLGNSTQTLLKNVSIPATTQAEKTSTSFVSIALTGLCLFGCVTLIQQLWTTYQASLQARELKKPSLNIREIVASMHHLTPQESLILGQFANVMNTHASLKKEVIQELHQKVKDASCGDDGSHKIEDQHACNGGRRDCNHPGKDNLSDGT